jgi:hypothetical protein
MIGVASDWASASVPECGRRMAGREAPLMRVSVSHDVRPSASIRLRFNINIIEIMKDH